MYEQFAQIKWLSNRFDAVGDSCLPSNRASGLYEQIKPEAQTAVGSHRTSK